MTTPQELTTPRRNREGLTGLAESSLVNGRVAGVLYLVIIAFGLFSEVVVRSGLVVAGDAMATARKIQDSEGLFRIGFAANLLYLVCEVALVIILYLLFRPAGRTLSLIAAAFRLTSVMIFGINLLNMFTALVILSEADYLSGFAPGQSAGLALLFLNLHQYGYALGLAFFAMNCLAMGCLLVRSSHVPTVLGVLLGVAGLGYLINSFLFFLVPGYDGAATVPLLAPALIAETWFCVLLLRRGGGLSTWAEPA